MSVTAQQIYEIICTDLLEPYPPGLQLGLFTDAQFFELVTQCLIDWNRRTAWDCQVYTQQLYAGTSQYSVPDALLRVKDILIGGRLLERSTASSISGRSRDWRVRLGPPDSWHEDNLPPQTIEVSPLPSYSGSSLGLVAPAWYVTGDFRASTRNLSMVGPRTPSTVTGLGSVIDTMPDDWALVYLPLGVLERVFGGNNELKNGQLALYCSARWRECIAAARAITGEFDEE